MTTTHASRTEVTPSPARRALAAPTCPAMSGPRAVVCFDKTVSPDAVRLTKIASPEVHHPTTVAPREAVQFARTVSPDAVRLTKIASPEVHHPTTAASRRAVQFARTVSPEAVRPTETPPPTAFHPTTAMPSDAPALPSPRGPHFPHHETGVAA